ncbi:MAG: DUF5666 domain-containing protein [Cellvibrionaceae bacterium]
MFKRFYNQVYIFTAILAIAACGGAGTDVASIEGTGDGSSTIKSKILSIGSISDDTNITVNGIEYDTTNASILVDGSSVGQAGLEAGQTVSIEGSLQNNSLEEPVEATAIRYLSNVIGEINSIDQTDFSISVLGQKISLTPSTVYGDGIDNFEGLKHKDVVRISGLLDSEGSILSTRVDVVAQVSEYQVVGIVNNIDSVNQTLTINNLTVSYENITIELTENTIVKVNGTSFDQTNTLLIATTIEAVENILTEPEQLVSLDGFITRFVSSTNFDLNGIPVSVGNSDIIENGSITDLGLDARINLLGEVNSQGVVVATEVFIINTTPLRFNGFLPAKEEVRYTIQSSPDDVGLWLTLTGLDGAGDLVVFDSQGRRVCSSIELSSFNDGFCYLDNSSGQEEWDVYIFGYADTNYQLTGYFRRAEFGPVSEIESGSPVMLSQYAGDRSLYRISTENISSGSLLAVIVEGLESGARLSINANGQPTSSIFSCELTNKFLVNTCWLQTDGIDDFYISVENSEQAEMTIYADFIMPTVLESGDVSTEVITQRQGMLYQLTAAVGDNTLGAIAKNPSQYIQMKANNSTPPTGVDVACFSNPFEVENVQCINSLGDESIWYVLVEGALGTSYDLSVLLQDQTVPERTLSIGDTITVNQAASVIASYTIPAGNNADELLVVDVTDLSNVDFEIYIDDGINEYIPTCKITKTNVNQRTCRVINNSESDNWTITIKSSEAGSYQLFVVTQAIINLTPGVDVVTQIPTASLPSALYRISLGEGNPSLIATLSTDSDAITLFAKEGVLPNEYFNICRQSSDGFSPIACSFDNPVEGEWYFLVSGNPGDNLTLSVELE